MIKEQKQCCKEKKSIQYMLLAYIYMPKMKFDPNFVLFTPTQKNNSKCLTNLNVNPKTIKLLHENHCDLGQAKISQISHQRHDPQYNKLTN